MRSDRNLADGAFALSRRTLKALADQVLKKEKPLPEEVLGSDLRDWRVEQLKGRKDYYWRHAIGDPSSQARAACLAQWRRTVVELEIRDRESKDARNEQNNCSSSFQSVNDLDANKFKS